jgi:hypothetical protein
MPKKPSTVSLYVRIPRATHAALEREAAKRGYPHTKTSVASQILVAHLTTTGHDNVYIGPGNGGDR